MPKVLIPLADGCEELEAVTVIDLLRRAGVDVISAGLGSHGKAVRASRGVLLIPDTDLDDALTRGDYDMVVLPGGLPGADHLNRDPRIHALLQRMNADHKHLAAICAAPKVLADAGLLRGRRATSFPGALSPAQREGVDYREDAVVRDGNVTTSRGAGTAMDFALTLIEILVDRGKRDEVERALVRAAP